MSDIKITDLSNDITSYGQLWVSNTNVSMSNSIMYTDENGNEFSISEMMDRIKKLEKRLSIISNASPAKLEKHKMLKDAYRKYKFIEELIGADDDNG